MRHRVVRSLTIWKKCHITTALAGSLYVGVGVHGCGRELFVVECVDCRRIREQSNNQLRDSSVVELSAHNRRVASLILAPATNSFASSSWPRTTPFQGVNTGSSPVANSNLGSVVEIGIPPDCKSGAHVALQVRALPDPPMYETRRTISSVVERNPVKVKVTCSSQVSSSNTLHGAVADW